MRVSHIARIDKEHVICVYYRRYLFLLNIPTGKLVSEFELPQPIPEGSQWPEEVYIKDITVMTPANKGACRYEAVLVVEKWGLLNIALEKDLGTGIFTFSCTDKHPDLEKEFGNIYSVFKCLKPGVVMFMNRDRKMNVYDTVTRQVLKRITI